MRLILGLFISAALLVAQTCAPGRIFPTGSVSAVLDGASCLLSDGTAYSGYRLDLPVRGQIRIVLDSGTADLILILRDASGAMLDSGIGIQRPIEAGSYRVLVNGRTAGQMGNFTVATSFVPESGMLCANFPGIGLNQAIAGVLGVSGCFMPDGTPYEAYTLNTLGAGTVTVSVSSSNFTTSLLVRDDSGNLIAADPAAVTVPVDADSDYQIVVATSGKSGAFQLTTSFQPADTATCRAVGAYSDSDQAAGSITADSCSATMAGSGDQAYYNYYNLSISSAGLADLAAASGDFNPSLYLLDESGNTLIVDSGAGGPGTSEIRAQLNPGNYTVVLYSDVPSGGDYNFSYTFTAGPPQPCTPFAFNPGDSPAGSLTAASCRSELGLADIYSVTLPAAGTLEVSVTSGDFGTVLALRDAKDNMVVMDEDVYGLGISHIAADLPAGTYTIVPAANFGAGAYQLTSIYTPHDLAPCTYAQQMNLNSGYMQYLGPASCRGANGQFLDLYQFTLPTDGVISASLTSSDFYAYLSLTDSAGNVLRTDDNSDGDNPLVVQFLPAGTYRLAARAASATVGGVYEIALSASLGPRPPFCASIGTLSPGGAVAGRLTFAACQYIDSTFADIYQVTLASDTAVDVRLNSADFDAYLVLLDAKGNLMGWDDDSGGGTNARLKRFLPAGTYYVVAKPFAGYLAQGKYTLSM